MPIPPSLCDHCGNETYKSLEGDFLGGSEEEAYTLFSLQMCQICYKPILMKYLLGGLNAYHEYSNSGIIHFKESMQLWPPPLSLAPDAPERVRLIYEEARMVMHRSPSSFVVQIGRGLEAITKDKAAKGNNLYEKINWLSENGLLPAQLKEMGHINRIFRNWAAHDAEIDVQPDDVEIVDEFFKAIVEYLYIAPAKIERVEKLLKERRDQPEETSEK